MHESERRFADHLESQGKNWVYHPRLFRFNGMKYQPDFYCPVDNTYYEVVGTRQAISSSKIKIGEFIRAYPNISFKIVKPNGKDYFANKKSIEEIKRLKFKKEKSNIKLDKLRKQLSKFLKEKDMALIKAGIYFGVSSATLSKFKNNKTNLNDRSRYKIEKGLGVAS